MMPTARRSLAVVVACLALATTAALRSPSPSVGAGSMQASPGASPVPTGSSARYLPSAQDIGEGWSVVATGAPEVDPAVFLDAASAVYVGPGGARVMVTAWTNLPGRTAVQRSWEVVGGVYEDVRHDATGPKDDGREEELAALPLPAGCVDARRVDGTDPLFGLPGAVTQCAVDPDVTVLVVVSGSIDGVAGSAASDRVATLAAVAGNG